MNKRQMFAILDSDKPSLRNSLPLGGGLVCLDHEQQAIMWRDAHTVPSRRTKWRICPVEIKINSKYKGTGKDVWLCGKCIKKQEHNDCICIPPAPYSNVIQCEECGLRSEDIWRVFKIQEVVDEQYSER